jgi:hypothetical protein
MEKFLGVFGDFETFDDIVNKFDLKCKMVSLIITFSLKLFIELIILIKSE